MTVSGFPLHSPSESAPTWFSLAACRGATTEFFFAPATPEADYAVRICRRCPVRPECLSYAIGRPDLHGIWGGSTQAERTLLRRAEQNRFSSQPHGNAQPPSTRAPRRGGQSSSES
jgi:WhiB family redox-sensing transcriptional regulator